MMLLLLLALMLVAAMLRLEPCSVVRPILLCKFVRLQVIGIRHDPLDLLCACLALKFRFPSFQSTDHLRTLARTVDDHLAEFLRIADVLAEEHLYDAVIAFLTLDLFHLFIVGVVSSIGAIVVASSVLLSSDLECLA